MPRVTLATLDASELADVGRVAAGDMTYSAFQQKHRRGFETVKRFVEEYESIDAPSTDDANGIISGELLERLTFDNRMFDALIEYQEAYQELRSERSHVHRRLKDDGPVIISWQSDLHLGHTETMYRTLKEDCETIRNTEGLYVILGGDLIDNVVTGVSARGMHHEQLTTISVQKYLAEELTEYLGAENVLAMLLGNHDEWSEKSDDFDPIAYLAHHIGCPYLGAHGTVSIDLGSESYSILCAHQFRMRSSFNLTHATKRLWDFMGTSDHDAVFMGHTHEAASETAPKQQVYRFFGQAGSYLRRSRYSSRLGFGESKPFMPGILIWPDEHKVLGIHDVFRDGPWILEAARARYKAEKKRTSRKRAA